jgi:hypothetical protein
MDKELKVSSIASHISTSRICQLSAAPWWIHSHYQIGTFVFLFILIFFHSRFLTSLFLPSYFFTFIRFVCFVLSFALILCFFLSFLIFSVSISSYLCNSFVSYALRAAPKALQGAIFYSVLSSINDIVLHFYSAGSLFKTLV